MSKDNRTMSGQDEQPVEAPPEAAGTEGEVDQQDWAQPGPPVVVYFHRDNDGVCSALSAWAVYGSHATYQAVQYNDPPPPIDQYEGKRVLVLDFSWPRDVLEEMNASAAQIAVLDHHKTARDNCMGLPFAVFHAEMSGATLAHQLLKRHMHPKVRSKLKWLATFVEDRDLWRFELPFSHEINAVLSIQQTKIEPWSDLLMALVREEITPQSMARDGALILQGQLSLINGIAQHAQYRESRWGRTALVCTPVGRSDVASLLLTTNPHLRFVVTWRPDEQHGFIYSLRSRKDEDFDCTRIAELFPGGGGHAGAAAFVCTVDPWKILDFAATQDRADAQ